MANTELEGRMGAGSIEGLGLRPDVFDGFPRKTDRYGGEFFPPRGHLFEIIRDGRRR